MEEMYIVAKIYEDDYGCEERPEEFEPQVVVYLNTEDNKEITVKQSDLWLYKENINEGDKVILVDGKLKKLL